MMSSPANIKDARVRKLADDSICAQDKKIAQMRYLVDDIEASRVMSERRKASVGNIVSLEHALSTDNIPVLDPEVMSKAEIARLFPEASACTFTYTSDSPAVLTIGAADDGVAGLVKLDGDLVRLEVPSKGRVAAKVAACADGLTMQVRAPGGGALNAEGAMQEAGLTLEREAGLTARLRGFYRCAA